MRFHVLLPVRDEADIVGQCLFSLLGWADNIYVFDTGSVDDTWEIVQDMSVSERRIKPLKKDDVYFSETRLRGWIFHQARKQMREGDWFLRADADEFHHIPPPEFVKNFIRTGETIVYHQYYDFCLLESEVKNWFSGIETLADRRRPIKERRRWYVPSIYSEPRLCRYRESMQWPPNVSFPFNAGFVARARLPIRHYPHRDPVQLDRRCLLRAIMMADEQNRSNWKIDYHYWQESDWHKFVKKDGSKELRYWHAHSDLPTDWYDNHLTAPHVRMMQKLIHRFFLPILDWTRPQWPNDTYPQPIPKEIVSLLRKNLINQPATLSRAEHCESSSPE